MGRKNGILAPMENAIILGSFLFKSMESINSKKYIQIKKIVIQTKINTNTFIKSTINFFVFFWTRINFSSSSSVFSISSKRPTLANASE